MWIFLLLSLISNVFCHVYQINSEGFAIIKLNKLSIITSLPDKGTLSMPTANYLTHGDKYRPVTVPSLEIKLPFTLPVDRIVYQYNYKHGFVAQNFEYTSESGVDGRVFILDHTNIVFSSSFEGWQTSDGLPVHYSNANHGPLSQYIYGTGGDAWMFIIPKITGLWVAHEGYIRFKIGSFSGDFSLKSKPDTPLVSIQCPVCRRGKGTTIIYPLSTDPYNGGFKIYEIPIVRTKWLMDPGNTLLSWNVPSHEDFIEVLHKHEQLRILGDFTNWYETIGIDDFQIIANHTTIYRP
jgi:hypothetical protein